MKRNVGVVGEQLFSLSNSDIIGIILVLLWGSIEVEIVTQYYTDRGLTQLTRRIKNNKKTGVTFRNMIPKVELILSLNYNIS